MCIKTLHKGWSKSHATYIKILTDSRNSIGSYCFNKHTVSLWLHASTRSKRHAVTCSRQSLVFEQSKCKDVFYRCIESSPSNTAWHLVLARLARMSLGVHFPIRLCQPNQLYPWHRNSSEASIKMAKRVNAFMAKCSGQFQHSIQHSFCVFVFWFQYIYVYIYIYTYIYIYLTNRTWVRNVGCVTLRSSCI
jgi:hypothetical protein